MRKKQLLLFGLNICPIANLFQELTDEINLKRLNLGFRENRFVLI